MDDDKIISKYLKYLAANNPSSLKLNDDVFFDKKKRLVVSTDTYNEKIHFKNRKIKQSENNKQIRNYGIGAQIIKDLKIKKMILITKTPKKIIGLEGFDIKITKQELI